MGIATALVLFLLIWWLIFFMVLPTGVEPHDEEQTGTAGSAPARPRIGRKMLVTTGIALLVWGAVAALIASGLFADLFTVAPGEAP